MTITRFEDLKVWQRARQLTKLVYKLTSSACFNNDFRPKNQMRDASVSIMSNIAELQSHSYVALDQNYISENNFCSLYDFVDHVSRMLSKLITYLSATRPPSHPTQQTQKTQ